MDYNTPLSCKAKVKVCSSCIYGRSDQTPCGYIGLIKIRHNKCLQLST